MIEQIDLFSDISTEEQVYQQLLPALRSCLADSNAGEDNLTIDRLASYSSVSYLKFDPYDTNKQPTEQLAFRVCLRDGKHYFGVSDSLLGKVPNDLLPPDSKTKPTSGFRNFDFEPTVSGIADCTNFLVSILDAVTYSIQKEFDCCSRFTQCSSAGRCVHPNPAMATSCGYRRILRDGKNFYVDNSTHDMV